MNFNLNMNRYETAPDTKRSFFDILFCGARWYLLYRYIKCVFELVREFRIEKKRIKQAKQKGLEYNFDPFMLTALKGQRTIDITEACGGKFFIDGLEHLRNNQEPVVIIGNHMSLLETFALNGVILPYFKATFVIKTQLKNMKVFGIIMQELQAIDVKRQNPKEDFSAVIEKGTQALNSGISVVVFPQSTRVPYFDVNQFNSIGIKLAKNAGVKVIPLAIRTDFLSCGKILRDFGPLKRELPIRFSFGAPLEISGTGKDQQNQIVEFIKSKMKEWNVKIVNAAE